MKRYFLPLLLAVLLLLPAIAFAEIPEDVFTTEEQVTEDREGGHWAYSSDVLSIQIERRHKTVTAENGDEKPLVYYVAHIYERTYNSYRSGFGDGGRISPTKLEKPAAITRRDRAVFAITGDNITQQEPELKGAILRGGRVFNDRGGEAVMAINDDLSIKVYLRGEINATELMEMGVRETYSFGPWLMKDGEANPDVARFRVNRINPRVGLGMIEPGHLVAIVVDGRQDRYSYGLTLPEFRDMFVEEGCVEAYNLDGGCSTGMIFMGEHLNYHDGGPNAADYQRPWVDALEWGYSELVPTTSDPYLYNGNQEG